MTRPSPIAISEYPAKSPPRQVAIGWTAYPPDIALGPREDTQPIEIRALLTAGSEELWIGLSETEPQFVWTGTPGERGERFEAVPRYEARLPAAGLLQRALLLAAGLGGVIVGTVFLRRSPLLGWACIVLGLSGSAWVTLAVRSTAPPLQEDEALAIFRPLHANIYRAFDYETESDVYDALARSVEGKLLDGMYEQIYAGLVLADDGGALCRVKAVDLLEAEVQPVQEGDREAFDVLARWTVAGQVHHWGHSHSRTNEYRARYRVQGQEGGWRIAECQVLEQRRLEAAPLEPVRGTNLPEIPDEL